MSWTRLAEDVLAGHVVDRDEALAMLAPGDTDALLDGAFVLRRHHFGMAVRLHLLQNAKSGACAEDCGFCSQSVHFDSPVRRTPTQSVDELLDGARRAVESGALTYCMVTATRRPSKRDLDTMCEAVRRIKAEYGVEVCTSLGLLTDADAARLREAGVDRYNHNLETSQAFFPSVVGSHTWADRHATIRAATAAGMKACAGGILGMGESPEDRVDLALALRDLQVDSLPVNLLDPRPGTPLQDASRLDPEDALRALAMFRFVHPATEIRVAGGREVVLGKHQPRALKAANSMFTEGYLTTGGQGASRDAEMLASNGFVVEIVAEQDHCGGHGPTEAHV